MTPESSQGVTAPFGPTLRRAHAALLGAGVLWGLSFLLGKWALVSVTAIQLTVCRFVIASAVLMVFSGHRIRPRRADWGWFVLAGILNVPGTFLLQFMGLQRTSASAAALMIGVLPAMVALASRVFLGERIGRLTWLAIAAAIGGSAMTVTHGSAGNHWNGDVLVLGSLVPVVGWILLGKHLARRYSATAATAWIVTLGTVALLPLGLATGLPPVGAWPVRTWLSLIVLGLGSTAAATALWNWGVQAMPAGRAGVYLSIEPLVGALLGVVILHDAVTLRLVCGGILIVSAAVVVNRQTVP